MSSQEVVTEGARERKRQETRQRIAEAGFRLFLSAGYDATTVDAIAEAAGIARRSFFTHFKSKDDIVAVALAGAWADIWAEVRTLSPDEAPLAALRTLLARRVAAYESAQMLAVHRLVGSSEALIACKQVQYAEQEQALHAALCEVWRQPARRAGLRMVALVGVGAMRLAIDGWCEQPDGPPAARRLEEAFDTLRKEFRAGQREI